ncbi:MAG TPA: PAS domain S-box protein [Thermoleophilaceae bacterium]
MRAGVHSQTMEDHGRLDVGLHHAPFPVSLWLRADDTFRLADVNDAGCEHAGLTREQLVGATLESFNGNHARGKRDLTNALSSDKPIVRELPQVMPSGEVRDLQLLYVGRGPDEVLIFVVDVTSQKHTEAQLRAAESRYRTLVSSANEGVWLVDAEGKTSFANAKVGSMLGRPLPEVARSNLLDFVHPSDHAAVAGALACPRDTPEAFEARFRTADGGELLCLLSVSPVAGDDGKTAATLCLLADMTAVQHERELRRETERRFRWIVETATEGIWTGDQDGNTTFMNPAAARMLGIEAKDALGRPFTDFVTFDEEAIARREEMRRNGKPVRHELRVRRHDGRQLDVIANVALLRDDNDEVVGTLAVITDVTRTRAEHRELRESRERFSQVFEEAPLGMAFIGAGHLVRGRVLGANRSFEQLLGYSGEDLLDLDLLAITHPDDVEREHALARELFENERTEYELDKRFICADGSTVWTRFRAHVLRDERGAPLYGLGLAVDISAERVAIEVAADAAARAAALLDSTPDAVIEVARGGRVCEMNGAALRMFGFDQAAIAGKTLTELVVPERLRARFGEALGDWADAGAGNESIEPTETTLMRADGSEFPAELRMSPVRTGETARLMLYVRNLALHDRAEAARREAEERFERLFRDGPVASLTIDLHGRISDVNPAFSKLATREAQSLIGRDATEVLGEAGDAHEAPWQSGTERPGPLSVARRVVRPDGQAVPVQLTASLVRDASGAPSHWLCQCLPKLLAGVESAPDGESLSYRERQVLGLLAHGHDGPAIAERLSLSPETVRSYAQSARDKLGAKTRTEAVALALVRGEISL